MEKDISYAQFLLFCIMLREPVIPLKNFCQWGQGSVVAAQRPYTAVMIVPTGTGASIGGFAGDSLPVARAMASVADCLITHPNVSSKNRLLFFCLRGFSPDRFYGS